ncbi:MAG: thiol:disulfide interchange protein DsbA/DsbL [Thiobacillaceae bacterium]
MNLNRRTFNRYLLAGLAGAALPVHSRAVKSSPLVEGRDYERIVPPQTGASAGRIEVLEFFSYGCPHCKDFHPLVMAWAARLPRDVAFERIPVTFGRATWTNLARLYYSLKAIGELERLDDAVFRAIHEERLNLFTPAAIIAWIKRESVDEKRFRAAFDSFSVGAQVARSDQMVRNYRVHSVPQLTVAGRYMVTGREARSQSDLLPIADALIELSRRAGSPGR